MGWMDVDVWGISLWDCALPRQRQLHHRINPKPFLSTVPGAYRLYSVGPVSAQVRRRGRDQGRGGDPPGGSWRLTVIRRVLRPETNVLSCRSSIGHTDDAGGLSRTVVENLRKMNSVRGITSFGLSLKLAAEFFAYFVLALS